MIPLAPDLLNAVYARNLQWYPPIVNPPSAPVFITGLGEIVSQFDLILLDSYGVLCRGNTPLNGAIEAIKHLRQHRTPFCVVSNDTMTNQAIAAEKYRARGFDFSGDEVLTSLDLTEQYLKTLPNKRHLGVIAAVEHPSNNLLQESVRLNDLNGKVPAHVDTLLFLTGKGWSETMQKSLIQSGQGRQFKLLLGNPDVGAPSGDQLMATPGYFLAEFVEKTGQQGKPKLFGKPDLSIFSTAMQRYGITDPGRVLMVGDTLHTDILGGNAMGCKTLLLQCGIYQNQDINQVIAQTGIRPCYISPTL